MAFAFFEVNIIRQKVNNNQRIIETKAGKAALNELLNAIGFSFGATFLFWTDIRHLQFVHFLGQLIAVPIGLFLKIHVA